MTPAQARQLILSEGTGEDGIVVLTRMGDDPGQVRMERLLGALRVMFEDLGQSPTIDRALAYALFGLANHVEAHVTSWMSRGAKLPGRLAERELPELLLAVESILGGEWMGEETHDEDGSGGP
jgi:hypothetical protein